MPNPSHHQTNKSQFADDAGQCAVSKSIELAAKYLQRDLEKLLYLSYYPHIKLPFDSRMTFVKHFEDILDRCTQKFFRLRILVNKKWGPSPAIILQICKQYVRPIFEYGIVSTITVSDTVINKLQRAQNSFIGLALCLTKYVSVPL